MERNLTHMFLFPVDACITENIISIFFGDENIASKNFVDEKYAGIIFGDEIIAEKVSNSTRTAILMACHFFTHSRVKEV